jgi:hypothetical protein
MYLRANDCGKHLAIAGVRFTLGDSSALISLVVKAYLLIQSGVCSR